MTIPILPGIEAIAQDHDALILDLWGVIHDGVKAFPGAADTLRRLKAAGKRTCLLSNAPRRGFALVKLMEGMGIGRDLYDHVMSSGEATHTELLSREDPFFAKLGRRCLHIGPERDRNIYEGLDIDITGVEKADFILNTGPDSFDETVEDYMPVMRIAAERKLPMVCANPDMVVVREGKRLICAGALAERYAELGGAVAYRGKPDPAIYELCLKLLGVTDRSRVLAVGDAFHTDIAGANAAGINSVLVTGGIHGEELGVGFGQAPDPQRLCDTARLHGEMPSAAVPAFIW